MNEMMMEALLRRIEGAASASGRIVRLAGKSRLTLTIDGLTIVLEKRAESKETLIATCAQPAERRDAWLRFLSEF